MSGREIVHMSGVHDTPELIAPYGGQLVNLLVAKDQRDELKRYAGTLPSIHLSDR
jgi:hypothetical protein